jgi:hypothetical protein
MHRPIGSNPSNRKRVNASMPANATPHSGNCQGMGVQSTRRSSTKVKETSKKSLCLLWLAGLVDPDCKIAASSIFPELDAALDYGDDSKLMGYIPW